MAQAQAQSQVQQVLEFDDLTIGALQQLTMAFPTYKIVVKRVNFAETPAVMLPAPVAMLPAPAVMLPAPVASPAIPEPVPRAEQMVTMLPFYEDKTPDFISLYDPMIGSSEMDLLEKLQKCAEMAKMEKE